MASALNVTAPSEDSSADTKNVVEKTLKLAKTIQEIHKKD